MIPAAKINLLQIKEEYAEWSESRGFYEIGAETILSFWREELTEKDRLFLTRFIRRWNAAVETLLQEQICAECQRFTIEAFFILDKNRMICRSCGGRELNKRLTTISLDSRRAVPAVKDKSFQLTLF